jgi:hypothetical protein
MNVCMVGLSRTWSAMVTLGVARLVLRMQNALFSLSFSLLLFFARRPCDLCVISCALS